MEEKPLNFAVSNNGGTKTVSHNSNNISLGSNQNFTLNNDAVSNKRAGSVREYGN